MELNNIKNSFSGRLKDCRQKLNLKQADLAKIIGISKGSIQNYEAGMLPKGEHLIKLSEVLQCSTDWLLKGAVVEKEKGSEELYSVENFEDIGGVAESVIEYEQNNQKMSDLLSKTAEILESETIYRYALTSNINAFHHSILINAKLEKMESRLLTLESTCEDLQNRLAKAEKEAHTYKDAAAQG